MEIKKSRERRLVERAVLGTDDMLCGSRDPASADISPVLAQHRHMGGHLIRMASASTSLEVQRICPGVLCSFIIECKSREADA